MGSLSLGVKLGGLGHKTFMSKLKQLDNNSNKNRGGQAKSVATFATTSLLNNRGGAMGIRTPDPLHAKQVL